MAKTVDHGVLFDRFAAQSESTHGGNLFDSGFTLQSLSEAHGILYDKFGASRSEQTHGGRFDDFGWKEIPRTHGSLFDEDFASRADTEEHGSWFDVFSGGNEVRYVIEGKDYEGTVLNTERDYAVVQPRDGGSPVEVGLSQFLAYRSPSVDQASPTVPRSAAHAPSADCDDAHGAPRAAAPEVGEVDSPTPQGQHMDTRTSGMADGLMDTTMRLKTIIDDLDVNKSSQDLPIDVAKEHVGFAEMVKKLEAEGHSTEKAKAIAASIGRKKYGKKGMEAKSEAGRAHKSLPSMRLPSFSQFGGNDVLKEVTTAERAIQGEENAAAESGAPKEGSIRTWCPSCKASRREAKHGECPDCKSKLVEKTSEDRIGEIAKAFGAPGDANPGGQTTSVRIPTDRENSENEGASRSYPEGPDVPEREHDNTDRVSDQAGPRKCPHCGQTLQELDEKTAQGQPHSHKCIGSGLDVLKVALS